MRTAHLVHGYLCVGKTRVAKELAERLHAVRFSLDEWMIDLYGENHPGHPWSRAQFDDHYLRVRTLMDEVWPAVLAAGSDVVLDFGFWTRGDRDAVRSRVHELGAETALHRVHASDATARERCRRRNTSGEGAFYIDDAAYDALRSRFEPLADDEEAIEIHT